MSAHLLKDSLIIADISRIQTAAHYQLIHTLLLLILVVYSSNKNVKNILSQVLLILGILLFSGNLYLYALTYLKFFVYFVPIGGFSITS